jgi:hypothetical protein
MRGRRREHRYVEPTHARLRFWLLHRLHVGNEVGYGRGDVVVVPATDLQSEDGGA